jgi:hypothetical protein
MKKMLTMCGAMMCALAAAPALAQTAAEATGEFSLQGRLATTAGSPVADGHHTLMLTIYARGSSEAVYSETDMVTVMNGIFSTMVGDNGQGGSRLMVDADTEYEIGVSVNNEAEMAPRIRIGDALRAAVAANAEAVAGFHVDTTGMKANSLITTDASGRLRSSLFGSSTVTSIQGLRGDVNFQVSGSGVSLDTTGGMLHLNITGGGGGNISFPYSQNLNLGSGTGFSLTNTQGGTTGSFINSGTGMALSAQATTGSAIRAMSSGSLNGSATIHAENTAGTALNLVATSTTDAALRIQNRAEGTGARLISAANASGNAMFEVAASGRTTINSSVGNALDVTTSAAGEAALSVNGGLKMNGPVGTGTLDLTQGQVVVNNAYARGNSIVMLTITSATGLTTAVPIRVSAVGNGSFTVSAIGNGLGLLTGSYSFNYLIINQ